MDDLHPRRAHGPLERGSQGGVRGDDPVQRPHDRRLSCRRVGAWSINLVLIHHRGVRTRTERVNPAMSLRDGDGWLVADPAAGAPHDPAWSINLRAHPDTV